MKHAGEAALDSIEPLLTGLRRIEGVRERKRGIFYRKSAAFIHFHEDSAGIFADLRGADGWIRLPVNSPVERDQFLRRAAIAGEAGITVDNDYRRKAR